MRIIIQKLKLYLGINFFDTIHKILVFRDLWICLFPWYQKIKVAQVEKKRSNSQFSLKNKDIIKVAFLLQNPAVWKYDRLYWLLEKHSRFKPIVVITPFNVHINYDTQETVCVMNKALDFVQSMGYEYYETYDKINNRWIDIRETIDPDIIFFTKPYKDTLPKYHIYHFLDKQCYYTSYGVPCLDTLSRLNFSLPFFSFLSAFFVETSIHKNLAREHSVLKGRNAVITSCLSMEHMMMEGYQPKEVWKKQEHLKKKIIWAPHHTID